MNFELIFSKIIPLPSLRPPLHYNNILVGCSAPTSVSRRRGQWEKMEVSADKGTGSEKNFKNNLNKKVVSKSLSKSKESETN